MESIRRVSVEGPCGERPPAKPNRPPGSESRAPDERRSPEAIRPSDDEARWRLAGDGWLTGGEAYIGESRHSGAFLNERNGAGPLEAPGRRNRNEFEGFHSPTSRGREDSPLTSRIRETCWSLIRTAGAGSAAARAEFAELYEPLVRAFLYQRWRHSALRSEIDDAVHDVFVECFRDGGVLQLVRPERLKSFRAFLLGVTKNVASRAERSSGRRRSLERGPTGESESVPSTSPTMSHVFDREWAVSVVQEAARLQEERAELSDANARRRVQLLKIKVEHACPIREVARLLGESDVARVHKEYARARREFRRALEDVIAFNFPSLTSSEVALKCRELSDLLSAR